jgi:hypothetical protein
MAAAKLLLAGLAAATGETEEELADLRRRNQELQDQVDEPLAPRWERQVEELPADTGWWDRWLPRLYEILGRAAAGLHYFGGGLGGPRQRARLHRPDGSPVPAGSPWYLEVAGLPRSRG